jgi:hypothetical protein
MMDMKNEKSKYILADIIIYFFICFVVLIFSKISITEKIIGIGIMFFFNIFTLLLFSLINYLWFKILKIENYIFINSFWLAVSPTGVMIIIFANLKTLFKEIEIILVFIPLVTIFLLNLYIKSNIIERRENIKDKIRGN